MLPYVVMLAYVQRATDYWALHVVICGKYNRALVSDNRALWYDNMQRSVKSPIVFTEPYCSHHIWQHATISNLLPFELTTYANMLRSVICCPYNICQHYNIWQHYNLWQHTLWRYGNITTHANMPLPFESVALWTYGNITTYANMQLSVRGGGLGSRPKKMYGERLGDGVEYHLMKPTPRR